MHYLPALCIFFSGFWSQFVYSQSFTGTIQGKVLLKPGGEILPCNIVLKDSAGKSYWPDSTYVWASFVNGVYDEFPSKGSFTIKGLPYGTYNYEVDRGPEFTAISGSIVLNRKELNLDLALERIVDMKTKNWWSGETHVHRELTHVPLLMEASDLHIAVVNATWNMGHSSPFRKDTIIYPIKFDNDKFYSVTGAEDERNGGAILILNASRLVSVEAVNEEYPTLMQSIYKAVSADPTVWIDVEKPFWWDIPLLLATGKVNSIGIAHNHMNKRSMFDTEAMGRSRDRKQYSTINGNALWSQDLYYKILNCGFRIPPSAGSASGVLPTSVGYNRAYAYVENGLTYEKWWQAVKEGKLFVSNGPLLDCRAEGKLPGYVFTSKGTKLNIDIRSALFSRDTIESIEIIKDGKIYATLSPDNIRDGNIITSVQFNRSGWFLLRVICKKYDTFRFASTAPYYVEIGKNKKLISRSSVQYFLDWAKLRLSKVDIKDPDQKQHALKYYNEGISYWQQLLSKANAE